MKNKMKVGLALLVAMAFIIPSGSIMAGTNGAQSNEADAIIEQRGDLERELVFIGGNDPIPQVAGDVSILQMTSPETGGPFPGHLIREGTYPITIDLYNDPGLGPCEVKTFVDIYEKTVGEEVIMYETSFEDNFDIYNNWVQIDEDCAYGGYYDSWAFSDARAHSGDHSMKSTMYDIYKGNQDDFLQLTTGQDLTGQEAVKVEFYCWVEGDGKQEDGWANYLPFDYLDFEIGDSTGFVNPDSGMLFWDYQTWPSMLPGGYYIFDTSIALRSYYGLMDYTKIAEDDGGGWWKVTWESDLASLTTMGIDITDFKIQFSWHTDPQFQYEGAYVDDVTIISIENSESKVFQSHSQGPFIIPEGITEFTFPMEWTVTGDDKGSVYDLKLWIQVMTPGFISLNDWGNYKDEYVIVEDWFDVEVDNIGIETSIGLTPVIPGNGIMQYGEDAHITADIHLDGTLPAENIPVTCTARKIAWEEDFSTDFEGMNPFNSWGDFHVTSKDAYSGSKSLGFFDEEFYEVTETWSGTEGPKVDLENVDEAFMDFYWKMNLGSADVLRVCYFDPLMPFVLGFSGIAGRYQPEWVGPMQPASQYNRFDLVAGYNWAYGIGMMRDGDGNQVWDPTFGFYEDLAYGLPHSTPAADADGCLWNGAFIDDITVTKKVVGEEVWSQTLIVPGPMEPCDVVEVQFEWEDVPYSNYMICVESQPDGCCGNLEDPDECAEILVIQDLEQAHWKEVETVDYTSEENGEWGICSSDYDNYLATNYMSHNYVENAHQIAELCIDGEKGIDVPLGATDLWMDFDCWYELEYLSDWVYVEVAEYEAETYLDWIPVTDYADSSYWYTLDPDQWDHDSVDLLSAFGTIPAKIQVRFRFVSDASYNMRGMMIDDISIPDIDFFDTCDNMDNFCTYAYSLGDFWVRTAPGEWCIDAPVDVDNALIWETEIADAYEAYLSWAVDYDITSGSCLVQVSGDGGVNWFTIADYSGTDTSGAFDGTYDVDDYTLTPFVGNDILVRFLMQGTGDFCVKDLLIIGKKDTSAPSTTAQLAGQLTDPGWYASSVTCTITATDQGAGMGSIHYILDGSETVVAGEQASFTISGNGEHNIEYWGVDKVGNVETPHNIIPTFRIDSGSPPTVAITAPEPGFYLFGSKLLSMSKVFIIGAFTAEATASDAESGVYRVEFLLDGDVVSEDTEAPFSAYVAAKHMGAGTLKAVAYDLTGNSAEDSLDITYYKFL